MRFVSATLVACVLFGCSALTSFDGLSGGDTGVGGSSSTSASSGGIITDGGTASSTASSSTSSASSTGGALADGGDAASCAFCTAFDGVGLEQIATTVTAPDPGKLEIDNGNLRARLPTLTNSGVYYVVLQREVSQTAQRVVVEVDVLIDEDEPWNGLGGNTTILSIERKGSKYGAFELYLGSSYLNVTTTVNGELTIDNATPNLRRDAWVRVRLEADFSASGSYKLYFDGVLVSERTGVPFPASMEPRLLVNLGLGRTNAPTPAFDVRYDNVSVTLP